MRTIVAGSRTITDYDAVTRAIEGSGFVVTTVLSGTARGVDQLGERWAKERGIPVERYPADWHLYGFAAGPKRNILMASNADALVLVWDGVSRGAAHMLRVAERYKLRVHVSKVRSNHEDTGISCCVVHYDDAGRPLPCCTKCSCGEWVRAGGWERHLREAVERLNHGERVETADG